MFPRIVLVCMFLLSDYLKRAYHALIVPLIGFFFLPTTTLAYAWLINAHRPIEGVNVVILGFGRADRRGRTRRRRVSPEKPLSSGLAPLSSLPILSKPHLRERGTGYCVPNRALLKRTDSLSVDTAACPRLAPCTLIMVAAPPNSHPRRCRSTTPPLLLLLNSAFKSPSDANNPT